MLKRPSKEFWGLVLSRALRVLDRWALTSTRHWAYTGTIFSANAAPCVFATCLLLAFCACDANIASITECADSYVSLWLGSHKCLHAQVISAITA